MRDVYDIDSPPLEVVDALLAAIHHLPELGMLRLELDENASGPRPIHFFHGEPGTYQGACRCTAGSIAQWLRTW